MIKNKNLKFGIFIFIIFLSLFLISCKNNEIKSDKLNIIVSILPQKFFVDAVGKELVNVDVLIPPGASPATYEPKPSDLMKIEDAQIYFRIGYIPFEKSNIKKFEELNSDIKVVDTSKNVRLRYFGEQEEHHQEESEEHVEEHDHDKGSVDPHIWLSPMQVKNQVNIILDALIEIDPQNKLYYEQNALKFKEELDVLHEKISQQFKEIKTNKILVFHPSWGYFADEYSLEQIAIENNGKEPTAEQLKEFVDFAKQNDIKIIFIQSQFNKEIAYSIAEEIGAVVVQIDPLSLDYINNLESISTIISDNLNK